MVYTVKGMSAEYCVHAIRAEVLQIANVDEVSVDLPARTVAVTGEFFDDALVRAAIKEGYMVIG